MDSDNEDELSIASAIDISDKCFFIFRFAVPVDLPDPTNVGTFEIRR